ncbi:MULTISPECIES: glutathione S-transferase family protein [unclassified Variovorax]|uniref:glutathione S-transferase family protein n=1 Tax=unclassified Variovorax TaxID=663243 RepID=UPI0025758D8B|nr:MULTISPECIES: glutathione S-transferase family protein [unclassified Variovorax]MDM0087239.1 glutathione S-transferase family protein [Variovorax sp. J22G40]MDM0144504.1 glutathione S-transferase family protein [Variovorax sp. J2P1-31]
MKLYDTQRSGNAWKVRLLAGFLGLPLTRVTLSIDKGDLRRPDFLRIAPLAQVPLLQTDDGAHLGESMAILFHLAQNSPWWPADPSAQARVLSWLSFEQDRHMRPLANLRLHHGLKRLPDAAAQDVQRWTREAQEALAVMDIHLSSGPSRWIATPEVPSIADVALYPYTRMATMGRIDLSAFEHVEHWLGRLEGLRGYQYLFPDIPHSNLMTTETGGHRP